MFFNFDLSKRISGARYDCWKRYGTGELWGRIEPLFARSNENEADANGPYFPCVMVRKALSTNSFNSGAKLMSYGWFFTVGSDALSKKSTTMKTLAAIRPKDDETAAGATSMAAVVVLRGELRD